jgi:RHS repeat-associated protein
VGSTVTAISGATGQNYQPGVLTTTTSFYRKTTCAGSTANTNTATVTVYPTLVPGTITLSTPNINYNTTPGQLTCTAASGGTGSYTYQWYASTDGFTYTAVGTGGLTYQPGQLTVPTYYKVLVTSSSFTAYTSPVVQNVYAQLTSGSITPSTITINANTSPGQLTGSTPTGGNGTYTYVWTYSVDGGNTYLTPPGTVNQANYTPGQLTTSAIFKRMVTSNGVTAWTTAQVTVVSVFGVTPATHATGDPNTNMNWTLARGFDASGALLSESKTFFDNRGEELQSQAKTFYRKDPSTVYTQVLASQSIRDAYDRPVLSTLPAPIDYADFIYQPNFVQHNGAGTIYSHQHFDLYNPTGTADGDKTNSPDALWLDASNAPPRGSLAWYYSSNNSWEPYTPTTNYPYTRQTFYSDGTGNVKKKAEAGDAFVMGSTHEGSAYATPLANELNFYLQVRNKYFASTDLGALPTSLQNQSMQMISRDANGQESLTITDRSGNVLMTARAGAEQIVTNTVTVGGSGNPDMNIYYFRLLGSGGTVTITGGTFTLYDMNTETALGSFTSGSSLPGGYYKLVNTSTSALSLTYSNGYADISYSFYNQLGQMVATIPPEGVKKLYGVNGNGLAGYATKTAVPYISLFSYDVRGRMVGGQDPDRGASQLVYRSDGKLRFSQNAAQAASGSFGYINYDQMGRVVESGQYQPDANGVTFGGPAMTAALDNMSPTGGLTTGTKTDVTITHYDLSDNSHGLAYTQDAFTLAGLVSWTQKYSAIVNNSPVTGNLQAATWYNYDIEGRLLWTIKYINGLGYKTWDYGLDQTGRLVRKVFQAGTPAETFVHYFDYDAANGQLFHVYTGTVWNASDPLGLNTRKLQATYKYYLQGGIKRVELGNGLQGTDYTYTLQGALKAINNSNKSQDPGGDGTNGFAADAFGEVLDYFIGDYINGRTGIAPINGVNTASLTGTTIPESYTGNIKAMSWYSEKPPSIPGATDAPNVYIYQYDPKYQFTESFWGNNLNFGGGAATFTPTNNNKERVGNSSSGIPAYDGNGNIQYMYRTDGSGNPTDQFTYNYNLNKNQLSTIGKAGGQTYATYSYDPNGQMASEVIGDGSAPSKYLVYDAAGRVVEVDKDAAHTQPVVTFMYDEMGQRVRKIDFNSSYQPSLVTFYADDVIYTQPVTAGPTYGAITVQEYQIVGAGRLGIYNPSSQIYAYQLADHLGNVRAVIAQSGTTYQVRMYNDYYPYGMVIPGGGGTNDYRYGYQGQYSELDGETGWNNFELRSYNSRIGRWFQYDPKGQFFSPYMGMGNNPVSAVDPDGGTTNDFIKDNKENSIFWTDNPELYTDATRYENMGRSYFGEGDGYHYEWKDDRLLTETVSDYVNRLHPPQTISNYKPGFWQRMENGNVFQSFFYTTVNMFYVTGQNLGYKQLKGRTYAFNLNGAVTTPKENVEAFSGSASFFIPGPAEAQALKVAKVGRIFWAGPGGYERAAAFAEKYGLPILGETDAGKNLIKMIAERGIPWEGAGGQRELWKRLSIVYAKGAEEYIYFFTGDEGFSPFSIWAEEESRILAERGVKIIMP